MAIRKIVKIDEEKCDGCGECVPSCAEGAIVIIDGKARLIADNLCDGLGACLNDCPKDAITIEEREANEFDEAAVEKKLQSPVKIVSPLGGCPGSRMLSIDSENNESIEAKSGEVSSQLRQWPIQLHLVNPGAPYFQGADILLAADCVAFAVGDFHSKHLKGKSLAIACPKLDDGQDLYVKKLVSMIDDSGINTITVMAMEVPCCGGLLAMAKSASQQAVRKVPVKSMIVSLKGDILQEKWI